MKSKARVMASYRGVKANIINFIQWLPYNLRIYLMGDSDSFRIYTHLTKKERLFLYKLALSLPRYCNVLEVGSYLGASASFLASGVKERRGRVFCVDTWKNETMPEGTRDTLSEFRANVKPFADTITTLRGKSVNVAEEFHEGIDLLFIDGDHSFEAVKADVEAWFPKLNAGAIVVFHDYYGYGREGVERVVDELVRPASLDGGIVCDSIYSTRIDNKALERYDV